MVTPGSHAVIGATAAAGSSTAPCSRFNDDDITANVTGAVEMVRGLSTTVFPPEECEPLPGTKANLVLFKPACSTEVPDANRLRRVVRRRPNQSGMTFDNARKVVFGSCMNRRALIIAGALLLAGCASQAVYSAPDAGMVELEPLLAVTAAREGLTIRVASNGCTGKDNIAWFVEKAGGRYAVAFGRRRVDSCTQPPTAVDLTFSFEELGLPRGARVAVVNPLAGQ